MKMTLIKSSLCQLTTRTWDLAADKPLRRPSREQSVMFGPVAYSRLGLKLQALWPWEGTLLTRNCRHLDFQKS